MTEKLYRPSKTRPTSGPFGGDVEAVMITAMEAWEFGLGRY